MDAADVQAVAAVATFLAACVAVWAALRAPRLAAEFAERLRVQNQHIDEERRLQLGVFSTLMQFRRQPMNAHTTAALNLIDVYYINAAEVRHAWKHLYAAAVERPFSPERFTERYYGLLEKMARHLGLTDKISVTDIGTAYYSEAQGALDEAAILGAMDQLSRLRQPAGALPASDEPSK